MHLVLQPSDNTGAMQPMPALPDMNSFHNPEKPNQVGVNATARSAHREIANLRLEQF